MEAWAFLAEPRRGAVAAEAPVDVTPSGLAAKPILSEKEVPWLGQLLASYPASPKGNAETRGLDSEFSRQTYVETELDIRLAEAIHDRRVGLVILCGNAGDGKTAFLQNLALRLGCPHAHSSARIWRHQLPNGLTVQANLDGSAAFQGVPATQLLTEFLQPFAGGEFPKDCVHLLAINDGPLLAWLEATEESWLTTQLAAALEGNAGVDERIQFIDLNERSLVGRADGNANFVERLVEKMLRDTRTWEPCQECTAQQRCTAWNSARTLYNPDLGPRVRQRLVRALQTVHLRGEVHVTARSLRAALAYIFFGSDYCSDLHRDPTKTPGRYFDRVFDAKAPYRQGDLMSELVVLDPAIEAHPRIDRTLLWGPNRCEREGAQRNDLASLRRQAYFEWPREEILRIAGSAGALGLARGDHLDAFLRVASGTDEERAAICTDLCGGIARLEDLPEKAFSDESAVPLRITPRTPTETIFWVLRPRQRFEVSAQRARPSKWIDSLHTHIVLRYSFANGRAEDLVIGAELFHLLMELRRGYQISDAASDDVFAHLSIFKQRLAQEDDAEVFAWNSAADSVYRVSSGLRDGLREVAIEPVTGW